MLLRLLLSILRGPLTADEAVTAGGGPDGMEGVQETEGSAGGLRPLAEGPVVDLGECCPGWGCLLLAGSDGGWLGWVVQSCPGLAPVLELKGGKAVVACLTDSQTASSCAPCHQPVNRRPGANA